MYEEAERNKNEDKEITKKLSSEQYIFTPCRMTGDAQSHIHLECVCFEGFIFEGPVSFVLLICSAIHQHLN
jgi:hypothetical protein